MRMMTVEALSAQANQCSACASLCMSPFQDGRDSILHQLVNFTTFHLSSLPPCHLPISLDLDHTESALVERTYMCALAGDERIGICRQELSGDNEVVASPSSRQSEERRLGDEQRQVMAADLMALGYSMRLATQW